MGRGGLKAVFFVPSRRTAATFARLADALGYVPKEDIFHAVKAIVATQRDYGRRDDRKYSRLKYLVQEWGVPKFRSVVEQYYGKAMQAFRCARAGSPRSYQGCRKPGVVLL